jgi:hypothetical protein
MVMKLKKPEFTSYVKVIIPYSWSEAVMVVMMQQA